MTNTKFDQVFALPECGRWGEGGKDGGGDREDPKINKIRLPLCLINVPPINGIAIT